MMIDFLNQLLLNSYPRINHVPTTFKFVKLLVFHCEINKYYRTRVMYHFIFQTETCRICREVVSFYCKFQLLP